MAIWIERDQPSQSPGACKRPCDQKPGCGPRMRGSAIRNIARCRKNAEPRIAPGRFSRSLTVISDNCLPVLLLVGSELPEQDFASEIFKQGVPLFRVEMDDCGLRFLRGQSGSFEPLCSRREPCPAGDCGSDI